MAVYSEGAWEFNNATTVSYYVTDGTTKVYLAKISGLGNIRSNNGKYELKIDGSYSEITVNDLKNYITVEESDESKTVNEVTTTTTTGTFTIANAILGTSSSSKVSITTPTASRLDGSDNVTKNLVSKINFSDDDKVHIDGSAELMHTTASGTAKIVADLTAGFILAKDGKSAAYSAAKSQATLANISGLQKNYIESTAVLAEDVTATAGYLSSGKVTLSKTDVAGQTSALGTSGIKLTLTTDATNNYINYDLALPDGEEENYKQQDGDAYWETKTTTATYKFDSTTGYEIVDTSSTATNKEVKVTAAKTTIIATVTGLNANITTDPDAETKEAQESVGVVDDDGYTEGLTATTGTKQVTTGTGSDAVTTTVKTVTVTVKNRNVLPASGTVKVTAGKDYQAQDTVLVTTGIADEVVPVQEEKADIWVISGNTATLKRVQLVYYGYYKDKNNNEDKLQIVATKQTDLFTLATVKGLNAEFLKEAVVYGNANDPTVISEISGIEVSGCSGDDLEYDETKKKWNWKSGTGVGTITINNATTVSVDEKDITPLTTTDVTLGKSDNFKLAVSAEFAPEFSAQKWNLSGTTATLKGTIQEGYTTTDDGKTITYTKGGKNQTLATINGLKKGLKIVTDEKAIDDKRTIGTYDSEDNLKQGITLGDGQGADEYKAKLSYNDTDGKLEKLHILLSANVLDTSKVTIKSSFYKLALDTENADDTLDVPVQSDSHDGQIGWHGTLGATAYIKQGRKAYYSIETDGSAVTYNKPTANSGSTAKDPATLATIKGLNKNITADDIEIADTTDSNGKYAVTIKNTNALTNTNVTITNTSTDPAVQANQYYLVIGGDSGILDVPEPQLEKKNWSQSGTTVTYKADVTEGWKANSNGSEINYTKPATQSILLTISGLAADLAKTYEDNYTEEEYNALTGDEKDSAKAARDETEFNGVTVDEELGTVTLSVSALNNVNVAVKGNYTLKVDADVPTTKPTNAIDSWVISGTTATFKKIKTAYYDYDESKGTLTYKKEEEVKYGAKANSPTTENPYPAPTDNLYGKVISYATIKGLKSGLKVSTDGQSIGYYVGKDDDKFDDSDNGFVEAITIDTVNSKFIINDEYVLNSSNVTLDVKSANSPMYKDYKIVLSDDLATALAPKIDGEAATAPAWSITKGTATYKGTVKEGYMNVTNSDGTTSIVYQAGKADATIITVAGLNSSLNADDLNDDTTGLIINGNEIMVHQNLLGEGDATLTTNVQYYDNSELSDYKFVLDDDVDEKDEAVASYGWNIKGSSAVYNQSLTTYYALTDNDNDDATTLNNVIEYHGAGVSHEYIVLDGIDPDLEVKDDGSIKGIGITDGGGEIAMTAGAINYGSDVTIIDKDATDDVEYTFADIADSNIPKPEDTAGYSDFDDGKALGTNAHVKITKEKTAGYTLTQDDTVLKFSSLTSGSNALYGEITGLKQGVVSLESGGIDGLEVDLTAQEFKLSSKVLGTANVQLTNASSGYKLKVTEDVPTSNKEGVVWTSTDDAGTTVFNLYANGTSQYYTVSDNKITYNSGGDSGALTAQITGLKATVDNKTITGITVDKSAKTITLSKDVLGTGTVSITSNDGGYKLALLDDTEDAGYVPLTDSEDTWSFDSSTGIATYKQEITEGYKLAENDSLSVTYTPLSVVTSTLNNLNREKVEVADDGSTITGIEFKDGVFEFSDGDALAHKEVKLTTKANAKGVDTNYTIKLASDIEATSYSPIWNKTNNETKATLTQKTAAGYTLADDAKSIKYSSDPVIKTIATVTGLKKEVAANENGEIDGLDWTLSQDVSEKSSIEVDAAVLAGTDIKLGTGDKFIFTDENKDIPSGVEVKDDDGKVISISGGVADSIWAVSGQTATFKAVEKEYYVLNTDGNTFTYKKAQDKKDGTIVAIKGLTKDLKVNSDGTKLLDANNNEVVEIDTTNKKINILSDAALTTSKVEFTTANGYTFSLAGAVTDTEEEYKEKTEWTTSGTTATYKTSDKANYSLSADNSVVWYNKETNITTYAQVSGIKSGMEIDDYFAADDDDAPTNGGTIKLNLESLDEKKVTLTTKGDFKLALDSDVADSLSTISKEEWSTSNTTSTMKATQGKGYQLTEDAKTINYYNADKANQTIVTVSGIKKGSSVKAANVSEGTDDDAGYKVITLDSTQLGTSKITVKGDYYKLALATDDSTKDYISETDPAKWIKAKNSTSATYTQKTYAGFSVADGGKTLNYLSKATNVNLITLNGLNKDITAADDNFGDIVARDDTEKTVTVKKDALTTSNLTIGKNDGYKLVLDSEGTAVDSLDSHLTYKAGGTTASIVESTTAGWEEKDAYTIEYKKPTETVIATISNLPKTLTYTDGDDNPLQGVSLNAAVAGDAATSIGAVSLGSAALADVTISKKVTLKNNAKDVKYELALDGNDSSLIPNNTSSNKWTTNGTTATLNSYGSDGYVVDGDKLNISLQTASVGNAPLTTISGLPKAWGITVDSGTGELGTIDKTTKAFTEQIYVDNNKVKLKDSIVSLGSTAAFTLSSDKLSFATENIHPVAGNGVTLSTEEVQSKGTATVKEDKPSTWGYASSGDIKSLTYTPGSSSTYATISGLNKEYDGSSGDLYFSSSSASITVGSSALTSSSVTIKNATGKNYTLVLGSNVNSSANADTKDNWQNKTEWVLNSGTATYKTYDYANYYRDANKGSIIYVAPSKGTSYATITGLKKEATFGEGFSSVANGTISLGSDQLGTAKVTLKVTPAKTKTAAELAKMTAAESVAAEALNTIINTQNTNAANFKLDLVGVEESTVKAEEAIWDTNGTTAKLTGTITKGWQLSNDKMSATYQATDKTEQTIVTISGLKNGEEIFNEDVVSFDDEANEVTYEDSTTEKYTDDKRIKAIVLDAERLGTSNITIKGEGYKLALRKTTGTNADGDTATSVVGAHGDADKALWENQTEWIVSGTTATYKTYDKVHYDLNALGTQITYNAAKDDATKIKTGTHATHVILKGLKASITADDNLSNPDSSSKAITLGMDALSTVNNSKVTLEDKDGKGYTLVLGNDVTKSAVSSASITAVTSGKVSVKGTQGAGYYLANDSQSVTYYSADKTNQNIAAVTGISLASGVTELAASTFDEANNTFSLKGAELSKNVGVSGTAAFSFDDAFTNASVTGSSAADKIAVVGSGISINAAGGNDVIDLGTAGGNTFVYASGNGNDVIANFTATSSGDKIYITNVKTDKVSVEVNGNDALVKVNTATIRLKGLKENVDNLKATATADSKGTIVTYGTAAQDILADDNYELTPQLSSIVNNKASSYTVDDSATTQDATALTKQSTALAYGGKK